tara:strand:- start:46 stop:354 length:309 start_codon:yes stop_codon:yes gene_type:complete
LLPFPGYTNQIKDTNGKNDNKNNIIILKLSEPTQCLILCIITGIVSKDIIAMPNNILVRNISPLVGKNIFPPITKTTVKKNKVAIAPKNDSLPLLPLKVKKP